jgi:protein-disulfide isomerase-like protein with CxxC motif
VRVTLLTDPWSVWCWGFEPVRRTLELRYPTIEFQGLVGGMFPKLPDPKEIGFDVGRFFANVLRTTGMPTRLDATLKDRPDSTYPACIHVHAVRLLAPDKEVRYLRALREAVYLDGLNISRPDPAAQVAERVGVGAREFREALASGEPERDFRERVALLHGLNLHAYPTLLVSAGERTARVEGFQALPSVLSIVESVSGRIHAPLPPPPLEQIVVPGERVATREIAEVLGVSVEEACDILRAEADAGVLRRERHPTGDTWTRR